ncbi:MAG: DUF4440 domain-containing protein [Armatimonadetes bacterium]|nr:DUF4440 domain-containing protein [Armatimonadota bacterium]MBS1728093.1 nuclear transport factor 2 family protein [Armatimonadota bacterium]
MNKPLIVLSLGLMAATSLAAGTVPKVIKARYTALEGTIRKLDIKSFEMSFSSDYVCVDPQGKSQSREDFFAEVEKLFADAKSATVKIKFFDSKSHDGMVDVSFDFTTKISSKLPKTPKTVVHEVGTDTWKQVDGQWVMVKTVDTKMDVTTEKKKKKG